MRIKIIHVINDFLQQVSPYGSNWKSKIIIIKIMNRKLGCYLKILFYNRYACLKCLLINACSYPASYKSLQLAKMALDWITCLGSVPKCKVAWKASIKTHTVIYLFINTLHITHPIEIQ